MRQFGAHGLFSVNLCIFFNLLRLKHCLDSQQCCFDNDEFESNILCGFLQIGGMPLSPLFIMKKSKNITETNLLFELFAPKMIFTITYDMQRAVKLSSDVI